MKTKTAKSTKKTVTAKSAAKSTAVALARYADRAIKVVNKNVEAREGTWRRFMLDCILGSKTTTDAQKKINASKEFAGRRADFRWAQENGYVKVAKKAA